MHSMGFGFLYPALMAAFIFGGSLEFVVVTMLMSPFAPLDAFVMALMVQSRHLFYGISMLEKYENMGWKKPFLMFWMCDETFALNYTATVPRDVDRGWFMLWVSFLNYFYWVSGSYWQGGLLGSLAAFDTKGLSFVDDCSFLLLFFSEQFLREKTLYRNDRRRVGSGVSGCFRRGVVYTSGHGSDPGGDYAFAEAN
ncbi:MAG: AzlC family ABC transporter permease [Dialister invisus]